MIALISVFCLTLTNCSHKSKIANSVSKIDSVSKIEMNLSAFGVESDDYPSIKVFIDLKTDSSNCQRTYYDPKHKDSTYTLNKNEIMAIKALLQNSDLGQLKSKYSVDKSDQPRSTTKIYADKKNFEIDDYGLVGDYPLQQLYKIVYKLDSD